MPPWSRPQVSSLIRTLKHMNNIHGDQVRILTFNLLVVITLLDCVASAKELKTQPDNWFMYIAMMYGCKYMNACIYKYAACIWVYTSEILYKMTASSLPSGHVSLWKDRVPTCLVRRSVGTEILVNGHANTVLLVKVKSPKSNYPNSTTISSRR